MLRSHGLDDLAARMVVMPDISVRAARELEHVWRNYRGGLQRIKENECGEFWRSVWAMLRYSTERGDREAAVEVLDRALDRVEPATARRGPWGFLRCVGKGEDDER